MVVLDTSVIIDHLRSSAHRESVLMNFVKTHGKESLGLSVLSIQELYEGKSTKDPKKEQLLLATITPLTILPYSYEVAKLAGLIARDSGRPIELADAAIAATAIINDASLATLNRKDFFRIPGLQLSDI